MDNVAVILASVPSPILYFPHCSSAYSGDIVQQKPLHI
nr:MAG: hypothetical protein [Bacteriophage sp.]